MKGPLSLCLWLLLFSGPVGAAPDTFESDTIATSGGPLEMTFIGHGSLMFRFADRVVHVDPFGRLTDYAKLPKADLILITHEHRDHLDADALAKVRTGKTAVLISRACADQLQTGQVMANGDVRSVLGLKIEAVPAYNLVHKRGNGQPFHLRGGGNGYVITFGDKRIYVAGDTENTPEMKALEAIDVAFLPMNLPYTMTPEMVADAVRAFKPAILYPYHYGNTDVSELVDLLRDVEGVDVRVRDLK